MNMNMESGCQVCHSGKSVRKNFGVYSCVSCRIFFSRNSGKDLVCLQNNKCRIEGVSRKSCAFCRYQKCLDCGMRKKSINTNRIKVRSKIFKKLHKRKFDMESSCTSSSSTNSFSQSDFGSEQMRQQFQCNKFQAQQARFTEISYFFKEPFDSSCLAVFDQDSSDPLRGMAIAEAILRKNLSLIKTLPVVEDIEYPVLAKMIKEKIFGLLIIYSVLLYDPKSDQFVIPVMMADKTTVSKRSYPVKEFIASIFSTLYQSACKSGCSSLSQMFLPDDNGQLYNSAERFLKSMHNLFGNDIHLAVPAFLGLYLFVPTYRKINVSDEFLRNRQLFFHTFLNSLSLSHSLDQAEFLSAQSQWLLLVAEVRHLELCHYFIGKLLPKEALTPLMREIFDA